MNTNLVTRGRLLDVLHTVKATWCALTQLVHHFDQIIHALAAFVEVERVVPRPARGGLVRDAVHGDDPADIPRLGANGITASMQPVHCDPAIAGNWAEMIGPERAQLGFAWPEYLRSGATLAFGTDTPTAPHMPLPNMYIGATRRSPTRPDLEPLRPDFALPVDETIVHGTADAAWASFEEDRLGVLKVGACADLVMIDDDLHEKVDVTKAKALAAQIRSEAKK